MDHDMDIFVAAHFSPNFPLPFPPLSLFEDSEGCGYDRRTQGQCAGSPMPTGTRVTL